MVINAIEVAIHGNTDQAKISVLHYSIAEKAQDTSIVLTVLEMDEALVHSTAASIQVIVQGVKLAPSQVD